MWVSNINLRFTILYNYKIKINSTNVHEIHEETAKLIYETCYKNDGLYVKFGQLSAASAGKITNQRHDASLIFLILINALR